MKEELREDLSAADLLDGLDLRFEIVRAKRRPDWSNMDEFLSLMDEGLVSYDDVVVKNNVEIFSQMELGHKTMLLLELHLQNPRKMSAERVVKKLLAEYRELKG